jgi:hypothetical protein
MTVCSVDAEIEARPHKHLVAPGLETTAAPVMIVPLPAPCDLVPQVTQSEKQRIIDAGGDGHRDMVYDAPPNIELADAPPQSKTWLFSFDHHPLLYSEVIYMLHACSVVDWTPGNGTLAHAAIAECVPIVLVVKNEDHEAAIVRRLRQELVKEMDDQNNERFYVTDAALGLAADTA